LSRAMRNVTTLIDRYDKSRMIDLILSEPWEFENYLDKYKAVNLPENVGGVPLPSAEHVRNVVIMGMGGSAIVGDILRGLLYDVSPVPIEVSRGLVTPAYVRDGSLMLVVSYSGDTMETITGCVEGLRRGAYPIVISSGGLLRKLSAKIGAAFYELPGGRPPRTALAPMLAAALDIVSKTRIYGGVPAEATRAAKRYVEAFRDSLGNAEEWGDAQRLAERIPVIYSYLPYTPIGFRLKTQLNENAKIHAFHEELPEANHNEIMGWEGAANGICPVFIRGLEEKPEIAVSVKYRQDLLQQNNVEFITIKAQGASRLEEYLYLTVKADLLSYLVALHRGVDPTPVRTISGLKRRLEEEMSLSSKLLRLIDGL